MSCEALTGRRSEASDQTDNEPRSAAAADSGVSWLKPGKQVCGRYEVSRYLGSGSTGHVVTAQHIELAATVALKFLHAECTTSPGATVRFFRAARRNIALCSAHIARVYDVDLHDGIPLLVTEALGNRDLRTVLEERERLNREAAVDYALQVCEALAAAHALGIVHGNLKPENIFVLGSETIKVVDFGISARALDLEDCESREPLTRASHVRLDAPLYLSPEQVRKSAAQDARSDIWSLGCVLYELLSGQTPFGRGGLIRTCVAILEQDPAPLRSPHYDVPDDLWRILERCLQKNPVARFGDVAELARELVPFGSGRYRTYAEQCRARLGTSYTASPKPLADAGSVVRFRAISVTSDAARAGIVKGRALTRGLPPAPSVRMSRTFALGVAADTVAPSPEPQPDPPAAASVEPFQLEPRVKSHRPALIVAVLCLVGLSGLCVLEITQQPAGPPRLLHLVTPRARAVVPEDEPLAPPSGAFDFPPNGVAAAPGTDTTQPEHGGIQ